MKGFILLAEDDPACLTQLANKLSIMSIADGIIATSNGRIAYDIFSSMPRRVSVVITDNCMPEMGGMELAVKCKEINPDVKIVLMSAYSKPELEAEVEHFVQKRDRRGSGVAKEVMERLIDFQVEKGSSTIGDILISLGSIKASLELGASKTVA